MPIQQLEKLVAEVPLGSDGLITQPQWIGTRIPESNPNMLGFFVGVHEKILQLGIFIGAFWRETHLS